MADAAAPGPWHALLCDGSTGDPSLDHVPHASGVTSEGGFVVCDEVMLTVTDATLIAAMGPGVALALAGHLDDTATGIERRGVTARITAAEMSATAVARRVLGEAS